MKALITPRWIAWTVAAAVVLVGALYGFHRLEQFLITDPRFTLNDPGQPGLSREGSSDSLAFYGSTHASARAIEAVFAGDVGRSVYLIPLTERRASLRAVNWVKDARVARFWPNRVVVGISERKPVAFVNLDSSSFSTTVSRKDAAMIDEDGVLLASSEDHFTLPLLLGVGAYDDLKIRHDGVQRMIGLMKDLGDAAGAISAVDVSDPDNLKIREPFDGHVVTLLLGDSHFSLRHRHFISYHSQLQKEAPWASIFDLRVEDRITAVKPPQAEEGPSGKAPAKEAAREISSKEASSRETSGKDAAGKQAPAKQAVSKKGPGKKEAVEKKKGMER